MESAPTTIYTVAAAFFAFLGLTYSSQPVWAQAASWWGSLLLMSIIAIFVVKNRSVITRADMESAPTTTLRS